MKDFSGKVAVVTGAASGIGRALTAQCLAEGMHVVMADIEADALEKTAREFQAAGNNTVLPVVTNVAIEEEIAALADRAFAEFGAVHLLCNNAGVGGGGNSWRATRKDWDWIMGVNLWSVIHGQRYFVQRMIDQDSEGHILNTASMAGLVAGGTNAGYQVTKHGVVALTESLYRDLMQEGSKLRCSVLCPGFVDTNIFDSGRNRPGDLQNDAAPPPLTAEDEQRIAMFRQILKEGMQPARLAEIVFDHIREEKLYILTHEDFKEFVTRRAEIITSGQNPPTEGIG